MNRTQNSGDARKTAPKQALRITAVARPQCAARPFRSRRCVVLDPSCTGSSRRALCDHYSPRYERFSTPAPSTTHASVGQIQRRAPKVSSVGAQAGGSHAITTCTCQNGELRTATDRQQKIHLNSVPTCCWWPVEWTLLEPSRCTRRESNPGCRALYAAGPTITPQMRRVLPAPTNPPPLFLRDWFQ